MTHQPSVWWSKYYSFPSISNYFRIPIIFNFLDFHCPTVLAVGTIFFLTLEHFFSNMDLNYVSLSDDMFFSTKIVSFGNQTRATGLKGDELISIVSRMLDESLWCKLHRYPHKSSMHYNANCAQCAKFAEIVHKPLTILSYTWYVF